MSLRNGKHVLFDSQNKNRYYAQLPEHHSQVNHVRKQEIGQNSLTSLRPASPASLPNEQGKSCSLFGLCYVESTSNLRRTYVEPTSKLRRSYIEPTSNLHRTYIEPTSNLRRIYARKTSTLFRCCERVCSVTALITKAPSSVGDGALFNMMPCRGCRRR